MIRESEVSGLMGYYLNLTKSVERDGKCPARNTAGIRCSLRSLQSTQYRDIRLRQQPLCRPRTGDSPPVLGSLEKEVEWGPLLYPQFSFPTKGDERGKRAGGRIAFARGRQTPRRFLPGCDGLRHGSGRYACAADLRQQSGATRKAQRGFQRGDYANRAVPASMVRCGAPSRAVPAVIGSGVPEPNTLSRQHPTKQPRANHSGERGTYPLAIQRS